MNKHQFQLTPEKYIFDLVYWHGSKEYSQEQITQLYDVDNQEKWTNELIALQKRYGIVPDFYTDESNTRRANKKWKFIKSHIDPSYMNTLLDFGGGKGDIAFHLGETMNIPLTRRFYMDIDDWSGQDWEVTRRKDIPFIPTSELSTIPTGSVDFILLSHVLHHIPDDEIAKYMREFKRILSDNGAIVLYEHDCLDTNMKYLLDIEHMLYDVVLSQKLTYDQFWKEHYSNYKSINEWHHVFKGLNRSYNIYTKSNDRSYYCIYWK
jgi:ubiquinone/menaquinone biosynthesis C-methylase UbiE